MLKFREIGVFLKKPSRDPVGTQSGPNRAPILAFLGTAFGQSGSSRDPVGHQFSNFWHHVWTCREAAESPKNAQKHCKNAIFGQEPTPTPIFPFPDPPLPLFSFSAHQPCTNTPRPSCTKTAKAVLSQTGVLQVIPCFLSRNNISANYGAFL